MLAKIKTMLGITTSEQDVLLTGLLDDSSLLVQAYVGDEYILGSEPLLQLIVTEMAIERYNRLGAEGLKSEDIEGHAKTFESGTLDGYIPRLDMFLKGKRPLRPRAKRMRTL